MQTSSFETNRRLIVRAIGTANPGVCTALARALPLSIEQIVRSIYQAPSVLLDGLGTEQAQAIGGILADSGLDVAIATIDERVEPGGPDFEVAVHVEDPARFRAVAVEVARFLGCELPRAVRLLFGTPAVILGSVSAATVEALRSRLEPLGAEVDASRVRDAIYDVFVDAEAHSMRTRIERMLADAGIPITNEGPLCALDVPRSAADMLFAKLGADSSWRLLDHAFARFDVVLESAPDTAAAHEAIVAVSGMPESLVAKVLGRLPVVLASARPGPQAVEALARLAQTGAKASAQLVTLTRYDLIVERITDRTAALAVLEPLVEGASERLARLPGRLSGPFGRLEAAWIAHELHRVGAPTRLEER